MSDTSLVFNLLAVDRISGVLGGVGMAFGSLKAGIALGVVEMGAGMIKAAGDFQFGITRLETGAGEAHSNLKLVASGILDLMGTVGASAKDLNAAMYLISSDGFHGADGLNVLKVAAEGAKVGNAELQTVADAVTTALSAYGMGAKGAATATNALIAAEGQGKTNLEALAGSLSTVAPIAAAAHVSLNEVLGAMATMTAQGTPAANAATYLRQTIGQLSAPSGKASQEMKSLGLSSVAVSQNLGKNGLASTLTMLTDAIQNKMGPAGLVLIDHLRKAAAQSNDFQKVLAALPPDQQTFVGALADMTGGVKSMQAALQLTGPHMQDFVHNTQVINDKVKAGGQTVEGWAEVQKTFNQRMSEAKGIVEALGIRLGTALLPAAISLVTAIANIVTWMGKHKDITLAVLGVITALVVITKAHAIALAIEKDGILAYLAATKLGTIATKAWAAAQWLLDAAMDANPIGLVIIGVAALAAGIFYLWTHSAGFRNFFIGMWNDIWGFLKAVGSWFAGPFTHFFVDAWHMIVNIWHSIASFFVSAYHEVVDPIVKGFTSLYHTTVSIFDAIANWFRKWWPLLFVIFMPFIAILVSLWNHFHAQIIGTAMAIWGAVRAFLVSVWNGLRDIATATWHLIYQGIVKPIEDAYHFLDTQWQLIKLAAGIAFDLVKAKATAVWAAIRSAIIQPIQDAYHTLVSTFDSIKNAIESKLDEAWNAVKGIGSKFASIGAAIVEGIISGIGGAAGGLFNKLKGLANDALNSAKSFLGVNSPSKLFAEHVGSAIPEGVALGIDTGTPMALNAVHRMGEGLANTDVMSLGGSSGGGPARTSSAPSTLHMTGNVDGAFATAIKRLIRTGQITFYDSSGQVVTVT